MFLKNKILNIFIFVLIILFNMIIIANATYYENDGLIIQNIKLFYNALGENNIVGNLNNGNQINSFIITNTNSISKDISFLTKAVDENEIIQNISIKKVNVGAGKTQTIDCPVGISNSNNLKLYTYLWTGTDSIIPLTDKKLYTSNSVLEKQPIDKLLINYNFEMGSSPYGWSDYQFTNGVVVSNKSYTGENSLLFNDQSSSLSYGMESNKMDITAGLTYQATANVYIASATGTAQLYIIFYDKDNMATPTVTSISAPVGKWTSISHKATAPANAVRATVVVRSSLNSISEIYFDDVGFSATGITNLDTQITSSTEFACLFGKEGSKNVLYSVLNGIPSKFVVIDMDADVPSVIRSYDLNYTNPSGGMANASWGLAETNGKIYISTSPASTSNGHLFVYNPTTLSCLDLGVPPTGASVMWDITAGPSGTVFAGTSPNGEAYKYSETSGMSSLSYPTPAGAVARSVAYSSNLNVLYVSTGTYANIYRYNLTTNVAPTQVLPLASQQTEKYVDEMNYIDSYLFARMSSGVLKVYSDNGTGILTEKLSESMASKGMTKKPYISGTNKYVYYTKTSTAPEGGELLKRYNITTNSAANVNNPSDGMAVKLSFQPVEIDLIDSDKNGVLETVVASNSVNGKVMIFKYNILNGDMETVEANTAQYEAPALLRSIGSDNKGTIYTGAYLTGGLAVYTPTRSELQAQYKNIDQIDTIFSNGDDIYFGVYPSAKIYKYDKSQSWTLDSGGNNPQLLFSLSSSYQHRIYAMAYGNNKLFVGSVPIDGIVGGALSIYNGTTTTTYRSDSPLSSNQSVISLVYREADNTVYGGTSIAGGMNATPTATACKFLRVNAETNAMTNIALPSSISSKKAISGLVNGPDGNIWGFCEGYLFVYNPDTNVFVYCENLFSDVVYSSAPWSDAKMIFGSDGALYVNFASKGYIYKIDATTKVKTQLLPYTVYAGGLAMDNFDNLYYFSGKNLYRYIK